MKVMIITSSPNKDGLTEACGKAAMIGVEEGNGEPVMVRLNDLNIGKCHACGNGWGTCRDKHECQMQDDFQKLQDNMSGADAYIVVTPVYWGEMSESAKAFFDRLRRCEAMTEGKNRTDGKPVISIAAAGGSGNGTITCLSQMERLFSHIRARKYDLLGITRKNRSIMLEAIQKAAKEMVLSSK